MSSRIKQNDVTFKFRIGDEVVVVDVDVKGRITEIIYNRQINDHYDLSELRYGVVCDGYPNSVMWFKEDQLRHIDDIVDDKFYRYLLDVQIDQSLKDGDKESFMKYTELKNKIDMDK